MPGSDSDADGTVAQRLSSGAQRLCERYGSRRPAAHRAVVCCALSRAYPLAERTERTPSRNGGGPAGGNAQLGALVGGKVLRAHACLSISKLAARGCSVCAAFGCWSHLDKIVFKKPRGFAKMRKRMASAKRSVSCSNTSRAENKTAQKHTEHGSPFSACAPGACRGSASRCCTVTHSGPFLTHTRRPTVVLPKALRAVRKGLRGNEEKPGPARGAGCPSASLCLLSRWASQLPAVGALSRERW